MRRHPTTTGLHDQVSPGGKAYAEDARKVLSRSLLFGEHLRIAHWRAFQTWFMAIAGHLRVNRCF